MTCFFPVAASYFMWTHFDWYLCSASDIYSFSILNSHTYPVLKHCFIFYPYSDGVWIWKINASLFPISSTFFLSFKIKIYSWERVGRFGRMALKHVKYHVWNELLVQVRCTILVAWGWCTGMTQGDGVGREEGGGFRMGNTCIPVVDSFWYLAKLIQLCKI